MNDDFLTYNQNSNLLSSLTNNEELFWVATIILTVFIFIIILFLFKTIFHAISQKNRAFNKIMISIRIPKERKNDDTKNSGGESNLSQIREQIGVAETLFSSIAGLKPESGIKKWLFGGHNHLACEIAVKNSKINFYIITPKNLKNFIEQQIHAQYPNAEIDEKADYNLFEPDSHAVGGRLILKHKPVFPLNTYKEMDSDPLDAILNPLSKVLDTDGALIQYVIRPAGKKWRRKGIKMIREIKQGEKFEYVAGRGKILKAIYYLIKLFSTKSKKDSDQLTGGQKPYQLTQMEEDMVKGMEEKISHGGLEVVIRLISSSDTKEKAQQNLDNIINSFSQYNVYQYGNSFGATIPSKPGKLISESIYREITKKKSLTLSTEEMASLWHLPTPQTEAPHIDWLGARKSPPPTNMPKEGIILGRAVYRGVETIVRIKKDDRRRHLYVVGKSGGGKSVFIENLAVQDIQNGEGVCVIDPHGDFAEYVLQHVPKERAEDVIYFNPADTDRPIGLNIMEATTEEQKDDVEKGLEKGAVDYLIKAHFKPSEVVDKIKEVLGKS